MVSHTVFQDKVEMRNFAYDGETGMKEETVKGAVAAFLGSQGYTVAVGRERERGVDIQATKEGLKLFVEAKGEGSTNVMFHTHFTYVVGEIVRRRCVQATECGVALPAHRKYVRLIEQLDDWYVRYELKLNFYLVHKDGSRVGLLKWDVK